MSAQSICGYSHRYGYPTHEIQFCLDRIEYVFEVKDHYPPQMLTSEEKIALGLKVVQKFGFTMLSYFHIAYALTRIEGWQLYQSALLNRLDEIPVETLKGSFGYLPGIGGLPTHARKYVGPDDLRRSITKEVCFSPDAFHFHGEACHREGKGYFITLLTYSYDDEKRYFNCLKYALLHYADSIREQFQYSIERFKVEESAGFAKIVNTFFRNVYEPQDGDLVVYEGANSKIAHAGLYRQTLSGFVVESKWGKTCQNIYCHELFFTPDEYGDIVKFYRLCQKV